ncbi:hypothetical protein BJV82DRAFT_231130 [Fennellomyces sp. T-0311]|nr:hypothetical protein BJV82DRAFT_231130 [Fennellomyces sp. T-0311]
MVKTRQASRLEDQQRKHRKLRNELDAIVDGAIVTVIQHCIDTAFDDDDTIARSTSALDRLKKASFTLLLERAKAFGRERKYTDAIADARKAIEYQPESAVGYITASYLYTIQEQHQEAITILESGLRTVPPSESLLLEGYHRAAKELLKQKTDFVLKLPVELTISIFTQLDNDYSLVQCVRVSKTWREFLLQQCPSLWSSANFGHHRLNPTASLLPSTSKYIRKLKVYGRDADYGPLFEKLIGILESKGSPRLHDIYIEIPSYDQVVKYAMRIIAPLRHQLTKVFFLTFDIDDFDVSFPLDQLLASCPNLEILQLLFSDENHVTYQPSQFTLDNYRLKKLLLTASNAESIFQQLIPRCPELECLEANICGQRTLALINQYCPRIRVLLAGQEMLVYPVPPNDDNHLGLYEQKHTGHPGAYHRGHSYCRCVESDGVPHFQSIGSLGTLCRR